MKRADVVHEITNLKGEEGHKWVVDTYNSISPRPRGYKLQNSDFWCAATVSAVFHKLGYDALAECSCPVMVTKAQKLGLWDERDDRVPEVGDVILYDWQDSGKGDDRGEPDHIGIVVKVDGNKITVREGNKNGSVGNRTLDVNGKYIRGYIIPPYDDSSAAVDDTSIEKNEAVPQVSSSTTPNASTAYKVGNTYTISVNSALNVRKGPGTNYGLVGYRNLTADARRHAFKGSSALLGNTRVTCKAVKNNGNEVWMQIPSGWICAKSGSKVYVK